MKNKDRFLVYANPSHWSSRSGIIRRKVVMVCAGLAMFAMGCAKNEGRVPVYQVKGNVTVAGEVPEGALIVLYPAVEGGANELRPSAKVGPDGSFSLTTYEAQDGAPAGDYSATIQWNKIVKKGQDFTAGPNLVPKDYASRESSPWKIKVETAQNELPPLVIKK